MASAKKLQHKIFGTPSSSIDTLRPSPSPSDPRLTINIPKPTPSPSLVQHKKQVNETPKVSRSAGVESNPKNYRDRLTTQLESEYESVERHRLAQDERRERHWKRWGPYLSERQWVRDLPSLFRFIALISDPTTGHCPRGLLGKRRRLDAFPSCTLSFSRIQMGRRRSRWSLR